MNVCVSGWVCEMSKLSKHQASSLGNVHVNRSLKLVTILLFLTFIVAVRTGGLGKSSQLLRPPATHPLLHPSRSEDLWPGPWDDISESHSALSLQVGCVTNQPPALQMTQHKIRAETFNN